jgi:hypothetical protein
VIAAAAWLIKTLVSDQLARDTESFKIELRTHAKIEIEKVKQELAIQAKLMTDLRTEFMAEAAIKSLLEVPGWELRSFEAIKKRIGAFDDTHLRGLLVRSGAIQFWGKYSPTANGLSDGVFWRRTKTAFRGGERLKA